MNKVLTISLNGNAYQLEEPAYDKLRAYLGTARAKLASNPDLEEIMRDLEQAIGDKLRNFMSADNSVAKENDVDKVLAEMGPVDTVGEETGHEEEPVKSIKKLYRLPDQAIIFGVCAGIAAYFNIDVTLVRVAAVALFVMTGGGFGFGYFLGMIFIPVAKTPGEREAAYGGTPVTAQKIVDEAMKGYHQAMDHYHTWDKKSREEKREMKRQWKEKQRKDWHHGAAWQDYDYHYRHRRGPSLIGEVAQAFFLGLAIYLLYTYVPQTQPFLNHIWLLIQQGWSWIFEKLSIPAR